MFLNKSNGGSLRIAAKLYIFENLYLHFLSYLIFFNKMTATGNSVAVCFLLFFFSVELLQHHDAHYHKDGEVKRQKSHVYVVGN